MTNYTKGLSAYIANLQYEDLPQEVVERIKKLTIHCVGAALAAHDLPTAKNSRSIARDTVGTQSDMLATVWGEKGKLPYNGAIFANATATDTLDWEDCSWTGHPSASLIPVSMALSEAMHCSGKEFITAVAGGFEVYQRIAGYIQPPKGWDHIKDGWGLCSWQIFAGSMPAGKLMNCDEEQFNLLIGATGCCTPVVDMIIQKQMSDFYHLQFGFVSFTGAMLARMAKRNELDNMYNILDDVEGGYSKMMRGFANDGWLDRNLGSEYMIMEMLFKHWPANMWVQTPLECLHEMRQKYGFTAKDVESIYITPGFQFRDGFRPTGYLGCKDAQFSIPYCLAAYMLCGEQGPNWFAEECLSDPDVLDFASRIKLDKENEILMMDAFYIYVGGSFPKIEMTITLKDGTKLTGELQFPKGHPRNPFEWEDCDQTFSIGANVVGLSPEKKEKFLAFCRNLENVADMAEVAECLNMD